MVYSNRLWEFWRRAETGPIVPDEKFTTKVYWPRVKELWKEYDIKYDPNEIVITDDTLINDVWNAGMELLLDVGILCIDTERIIRFKDNEVKEGLATIPREITIGEGKDKVTATSRKLDDGKVPIVMARMLGPTSEEIYVKEAQSLIQEPLVDFVHLQGNLTTLNGCPVKTGSPTELSAMIAQLAMRNEARRRAGRPGIHDGGSSGVTPMATLQEISSGGVRKGDARHVYIVPQLKTAYQHLSRVFSYMTTEIKWWSGGFGYIGGPGGSWGTSVITGVAEWIAAWLLYQPTAYMFCRATLSAPHRQPSCRMSFSGYLGHMAVVKRTGFPMMMGPGGAAVAGICTEMSLFEAAAYGLMATQVCGVAGAGTGYDSALPDRVSGIETRLAAEVAHAGAGMKRENANEMMKQILSKYEHRLKEWNIPKGKKFQECYDFEAITPTKEYVELYNKVKQNLEDLGLTFKF